jgi:hypothetical protein
MRGVALWAGRGPGTGVGTSPVPPLRAHRAGLAALGDAGRGDEPARPGRMRGQGPQLGQSALGTALSPVRAAAGGGARRGCFHLGGQSGWRAPTAPMPSGCSGRCAASRCRPGSWPPGWSTIAGATARYASACSPIPDSLSRAWRPSQGPRILPRIPRGSGWRSCSG